MTIVDYGSGNLLSVKRAFEKIGATVEISGDSRTITRAKRVLLPGVGAFPRAVTLLTQLKLVSVLQNLPKTGIPLLGICLGMQLLMDSSKEFENTKGLGIIPGNVIEIPESNIQGVDHRVPHIGWNPLKLSIHSNSGGSVILNGVSDDTEFYFVHSYMVNSSNKDDVIAHATYGSAIIPAIIGVDTVLGCQFHPEKSGKAGLRVLENFLQL